MDGSAAALFEVVLYQPEIPPNTGNVIRLCANTGCRLNLIHPLGFSMDQRHLRRAGLDYHELTSVREFQAWDDFLRGHGGRAVWAFSTRAGRPFHQVAYRPGDALLFGPETRGLPSSLMRDCAAGLVRIPMRPGNRSLNLSNAVAVAVFEGWRQQGYAGA